MHLRLASVPSDRAAAAGQDPAHNLINTWVDELANRFGDQQQDDWKKDVL
jgi:hypothetical protein